MSTNPVVLIKPHFRTRSSRMSSFRLELLHAKPSVCVERAKITTETYRDNMDQPLALRRALMYKNVLEKMSIYIEPQTLIAGNQASSNRSAPVFPEYAMDWVIDELDQYDKRDGDRFYITEENKQILKELGPFWKHNTVKDRGLAAMPESAKIFYDLGIIKAEGNITSGDAHVAVNYDRMLRNGLEEYRNRAEQKLEALDLTEYTNLAKSYFYRAVIIVIDATAAFARRYAELAEKTAVACKNTGREEELLRMAAALRRLPLKGAENFYEAVQSLWLVHLCLQIESNGHSLSYGRMDQYLYPYYEADLRNGRINDEAACELLTNFWLKTFTINKIRQLDPYPLFRGEPPVPERNYRWTDFRCRRSKGRG